MKSLKEYFKARLMEDLTDLNTQDIEHLTPGKLFGNTARQMPNIESSRHLYKLSSHGVPEKVPGVMLSPEVTDAINAVVIARQKENPYGHDTPSLSPKHIETLRSFVKQHGHVVGNADPSGTQYPGQDLRWSTHVGYDPTYSIAHQLRIS